MQACGGVVSGRDRNLHVLRADGLPGVYQVRGGFGDGGPAARPAPLQNLQRLGNPRSAARRPSHQAVPLLLLQQPVRSGALLFNFTPL